MALKLETITTISRLEAVAAQEDDDALKLDHESAESRLQAERARQRAIDIRRIAESLMAYMNPVACSNCGEPIAVAHAGTNPVHVRTGLPECVSEHSAKLRPAS